MAGVDGIEQKVLFSCSGGQIVLPGLLLLDRADGGNLWVLPPRPVWDRTELSPAELSQWQFLIAATAKAMLETLPQLAGGCINYWDAGNWALNHDAEPVGPKNGPEHRRVHMHLMGRSPQAKSPDWRWGEAPVFGEFAEKLDKSAQYQPLTEAECEEVVAYAKKLLVGKYHVAL